MTEKNKRGLTYALAFLLPAAVILGIFALLGIFPFGEKTLVVWDVNAQYLDFLLYFKKVLTGQASWTYTFSKTLGGDMIGFLGYYLLSPFNLIILLFSDALMPYAFQLIYVLKMAVCGVTCQYYWNSRQSGCKISSVLFSAAFALSGYLFTYGYNIMWLDAVMLLPLLTRGLERLVEENRFGLYLVSLSLGLITCYYMGYMLCLYSVLYFLIYWCAYGNRQWKRWIRFLVTSLFSGCILAVVLVPMAFSVLGTRESASFSGGFFTSNYSLRSLFGSMTTASFAIEDINNPGLAPLFLGLLIFWLVLRFFFDREIPVRQKLVYGSLAFILLFCTWNQKLNLIWHAFSEPSGCNYRYVFIIDFLCIVMAWKTWSNIKIKKSVRHRDREKKQGETEEIAEAVTPSTDAKAQSPKRRRWTECDPGFYAFILACLCVAAAYVLSDAGAGTVAADLILLAVFYILSRGIQYRQFARASVLFTGLLLMADFGWNGAWTWDLLIDDAHFSMTWYSSYMEYLPELASEVNDLCAGEYRMELHHSLRHGYNDAMALGYAGVSHYSSSEKLSISELEDKLDVHWWEEFELPDEFTDSLFGIRYMITNLDEIKSYTCIATDGEYKIFENENALPLVFGTWNAEEWDDILETRDPYHWPQYEEASEFTKKDDANLSFTIRLEEDGQIRTTIPWDRGWTVTVDGVKVNTSEWLDVFLCFDAGAGEHEIVMKYQMPGFYAGLAITAVTAVLGAAWVVETKGIQARKNKLRDNP